MGAPLNLSELFQRPVQSTEAHLHQACDTPTTRGERLAASIPIPEWRDRLPQCLPGLRVSRGGTLTSPPNTQGNNLLWEFRYRLGREPDPRVNKMRARDAAWGWQSE
ncbi:Hypothetical predicted protein [Pelobates cultripes]|uniref:Uncharacterized protein n=1 Tax=Pelobates cultripes TaxID=61616 RepID=A0AAD1S9R0_PELCU|nr:Hypothetical predicted protein [Pelobates cultripes]